MKRIILGLVTATALLCLPALAADPAIVATEKNPGSGSRFFQRVDTSKDGAISLEEWRAKNDRSFAKIDGNHDGKISVGEMSAHQEKRKASRKKRANAHKPDAKAEGTKTTPTPTAAPAR